MRWKIAINAIDFGNTLFITNDIARSHFPGPRICTEQHVNEWVALRDQCAADAEMKFWRCVNCVHPEGYEICPVLFFRLRFARTCSRFSRRLICLSTTQNRLPPARRSTRPSITPPTSSPRPSLDNRASDISNLLDGIGNGVQVLQAANTGITSLQKLVDSAKSVANQVLQAAVGYSTKSNVTAAAVTGATADDLRGTPSAFTNNTVTGAAIRAVLRRRPPN